jgi:uncharacterized protein YgbK (DUF1537 family)
MKLGCIGDDFTGSSDLANTLAKGGMNTVQYVGVPSQAADASVEAGVVALKSRSIPAADAVAQSLAALAWLRDQGCTQFLFKYCSTFDSTPQGNIGAVAVALADALQTDRVIFCPAFPATGRSIYMGHLFVQDRLLSESGMEHHPLTPMTDPDLRRWLGRQVTEDTGHVALPEILAGPEAVKAALAREAEAGRRLIVVDAASDADLVTIGRAAADLPLITGGSGIAIGLPANYGCIPKPVPWTGVPGPALVLSGSCSAVTRTQVARHIAQGHPAREVTVEAVLDGRADVASLVDWALDQRGVPLIYSSADPDTVGAAQANYGRARSAEALEGLFAALARRAVAQGVTRLICAGGETSGAVVEALDVTELAIGPEIAPGVPALRAGSGPALALKSGNFGSEDFFARAATMLAP